jgi:hypothetical protein
MSAVRPIPHLTRTLLLPRWLLILASILLLTGCAPDGESEGPSGILLVTVEAFRADTVGLYGGEASMPSLERLAGLGTLYEDAVTPVPMARPALSAILTGVAPDRTGVRSDVDDRLPSGISTVASLLAESGWSTAAITGSWFSSWASGLDRGFEIFDGPEILVAGPARYFPPLVPDDDLAHKLSEWLATIGPEEPFFAWVNLPGLHALDAEPAESRAAYLEMLEGTDRAIGAVLDSIEGSRGLDDTAIIVVGSHGMLLGEDGAVGSSYWLRDETLRVPLVVKGPGFAAGARSSAPVWLPDVAAAIAGFGRVSLGDDSDAESLGNAGRAHRRAWSWAPDDEFAWPTLTAVEGPDGWVEFSWAELSEPDGSEELRRGTSRPARPRVRELPESLMRRLEELGAVEEWRDDPSPALTPEETSDFLMRIRGIRQLFGSPRGEGRGRKLRLQSRDLKETYPLNLGTVVHRLFFLVMRGGQTRGEFTADRALRRFPLRSEALHWAAHIALLEGKIDRGDALIEAALATSAPGNPDLLYDLACTRALSGDATASVRRLEEALDAGFRNWEHLEQDMDLDGIRTDPRYVELLRKHGR